jgi:flagellar basal-body rod protein FlgB
VLFNNTSFKAMQKSLDMLWLKQQVISDNIANSETPGYKAKSVKFYDVLQNEDGKRNAQNNQGFRTVITRDNSSIRPDGNNVDMEKENLELWRTYAQYSYLTNKISGEFKDLRYVINQALK